MSYLLQAIICKKVNSSVDILMQLIIAIARYSDSVGLKQMVKKKTNPAQIKVVYRAWNLKPQA